MTEKNTLTKKGNLMASLGGLFTILSLMIIEDKNWKIIAAAIGVVLALYGLILLGKAKR